MTILEFSLAAWRREPDMRIEDAYKWLFHATRGGEHAITSEEGPRRWLEREWPTLTVPFTNESMTTPLRPDGKIVRLNLRPYRKANGDKEKLLTAFVASAKGFKGKASEFPAVWHGLGEVLKQGKQGGLTVSEWRRLDKEAAAFGYPAIDHSPHYTKARKPAYRVLTDTEARSLVATLTRAV